MSNPKLHPLLISNPIPCCEIQAKLIIKKISVPKEKKSIIIQDKSLEEEHFISHDLTKTQFGIGKHK